MAIVSKTLRYNVNNAEGSRVEQFETLEEAQQFLIELTKRVPFITKSVYAYYDDSIEPDEVTEYNVNEKLNENLEPLEE